MIQTQCGNHPERPLLRTPWWTYACPTCNSETYETLMAPDVRPVIPTRALCPFCMLYRSYASGRFAIHQDQDEQCRGSGLTEGIANRMLHAIMSRTSVKDFLLAEPPRRTPPPRQVTTEPPMPPRAKPRERPEVQCLVPFVDKLAVIRKQRKLSAKAISRTIGGHEGSVSAWECRQNIPAFSSALAWANYLDQDVVLLPREPGVDGSGPLRNIDDAIDFFIEARKRTGMTHDDLASRLNLASGRVVQARERRRADRNSDLRLHMMIEWADVLQIDLILKERKP